MAINIVGMTRLVLALGVGLMLLPASGWAACGDAPMFSTASSHDAYSGMTSFVVAARDKEPGCPLEGLRISAAGLEPYFPYRINDSALGEASMMVTVQGSTTPATFNITYAVTDSRNNSTSVSLPIRLGVSNRAPQLDPISDLIVSLGQTASFTVGSSDLDKDIALSQLSLVVDGLPTFATKTLVQYTTERMAIRVSVTPTSLSHLGTYRIHIVGKDVRGGQALAQMRITVQ